jgi:universal stress protein A
MLIATDATADSDRVASRAARIAKIYGSRVTLLHVLEHLPTDIPVEPVPPEGVDKIEWFRNHALNKLEALADRSGLSAAGITVAVTADSARKEIVRFAQEQGVDLIIIGAHERHGMAFFHGATTDGVVHKAPCDVLLVHI